MISNIQEKKAKHFQRLPPWFAQEIPDAVGQKAMQAQLRARGLSTVCESARCPNMGQCWGRGVATFMILGNVCTRACRFCAVETGRPGAVDPDEPQQVAQMVKELGLAYVVITSVTRDDLEDEGALQFVRTVEALRQMNPATKIELLIPDFSGRVSLIRQVVDAAPDVLGHNIEMAGHLFPAIRPQAGYRRSLEVLRQIKERTPSMIVKSGFMVGLGETDQDVYAVMKDLKDHGCDLLTIGQYLAPSKANRHLAVQRFVSPEMFETYRAWGEALGFRHVMSAPLVRSSYIAETGYRQCLEKTAA